jgi:hypothetical protein
VSDYRCSDARSGRPRIAARVRVWDITLAQRQSTDFGRHEYDFVTMFLVGGQFRTTSENGATVTERRFGEAVYSHKGAKQEEELIAGGPAEIRLG